MNIFAALSPQKGKNRSSSLKEYFTVIFLYHILFVLSGPVGFVELVCQKS
jgi:hypothetical protein